MTLPISGARAVAPLSSASDAAAASKVATDFFAAFSRRDAAAMEQAYDPKVRFRDPLFGTLRGRPRVMEMWNTIIPAANAQTFEIKPSQRGAPVRNPDGSYEVRMHWDASYDLGKRHVENHADTVLTIRDGKIISQRDDWDLKKWTAQAVPHGSNAAADDLARIAARSFIHLKSLLNPGGWVR